MINVPKHELHIREWWTRKTKKVSRYILISSIVSLIASMLFFEYAPPALIARIQIFNGAMTLPVGGAIWIAAFIFQFLIPSREVAFRSQETLERTELRVKESLEKFDKFMTEEAGPAIQLLRKTVEAFETRYSKNIETTVDACQDAARDAVETAQRTETMARELHREALPMIQTAARVIEKVDKALNGGLLAQIGLLAKGAQTMGEVKGGATVPDLNRALTSLKKKPEARTPLVAPAVPKPEKPAISFHEALTLRSEKQPAPAAHPRVIASPVPAESPEVERSLS